MTGNTHNLGIVGRVTVTIYTLCPLAIVTSAVNREILTIVVKGRWHPVLLTMTRSTVIGKLSCHVIRIGGSYIIIIVTNLDLRGKLIE